MTGLHETSAAAIARDVASGAVSAEAVARAALDRIARFDARVGAFTHVARERAPARGGGGGRPPAPPPRHVS